jgi:hypothetical protein
LDQIRTQGAGVSTCPGPSEVRAVTAFDAGEKSQPKTRNPASAPASWETMKDGADCGAIPAKLFVTERAIVTAGFANDVDAVNQ